MKNLKLFIRGRYALAILPVFGVHGPPATFAMCLPDSCKQDYYNPTHKDFLTLLRAILPKTSSLQNTTSVGISHTKYGIGDKPFEWDNVNIAFV